MVMKLLKNPSFLIGLVGTALFLPGQANATVNASVPEPLSMALLAVGAAGLGAAAWIRGRKDK
jgi:hypothetical protein